MNIRGRHEFLWKNWQVTRMQDHATEETFDTLLKEPPIILTILFASLC